MKRGLLAAAFLLASADFVSADYVIIVANVGGKELKTPAAGMAGMRGGMMMGMRGGMAGMRGAMGGMPPGMGAPGVPPGMAAGGGVPGANAAGVPPGMGAPGAPPGMAAMGGGMMGMRGGMMGMRGGMMGMRGGMMGGMMGGAAGSLDADDLPYFVIAVVEVKPTVKNMADTYKKYEEQGRPLEPIRVNLPERLGKACFLLKNPSFGEMFIITESKGKAIPTVAQRFKEDHDKVMKGTPTESELLRLAGWTLEHGLLDKFPGIMNKLVEIDKSNDKSKGKSNGAAVAYLKVKPELDRAATNDPSVASWRGKLLSGYKVTETPHYLIVHNAVDAEIKTHGEHLENAFRSFYYWFALHSIALPVPRTRQVVILTSQKGDFDKLNKILSSGPVVVDGFFARRENLAVMTSQRRDATYEALKTYWKTWQDKGYQRSGLLAHDRAKPKSAIPQSAQFELVSGQFNKLAEAQMLALMLKALEEEAQLATISHDASRQLLFASGLLPRNVAVPEWILFGMGSFFETPLQSPWPTVGAPSPYYLPRWRELKSKNNGGLEKTRVQTLRKVVTDGYFRTLPPDGKTDSEEHHQYESALRKARTVSWSLTYFLAQQKLDGLRSYFAELSKMPRDLELDDAVLLGCFARAFGCVDGNNKIDEARLTALANEWNSYWQRVNFESEPTMKDIREKIAKKVKETQEQAQKRQNPGNGGQPGGFPPGVPGGFQPNGQQPGGFPPASPATGRRPTPGDN